MSVQPPRQRRQPPAFISDTRGRQLVPDPTADSRALADMQVELDEARNEYALRNYDAVAERINRLLAEVGPAGTLQRADVERQLLRASALSLAARLTARKRSDEQARPQFEEALRAFEALSDHIAAHKCENRLLTDYAIVLTRTGRRDAAAEILEQVCRSGAAPAEAFGYLGYAYKQRGQLAAAEEAYQKGLQLAHRDPPLLKYLAETLEEAGPERRSDAVAAYCDAADAWGRIGDLTLASELAHRALDLDPASSEALKIAYWVDRDRGDVDSFSTVLKRALEKDAGHPWARALHGLLLRDRGHLAEAAKEFEAVNIVGHDLSWVLLERSRALRTLRPDDTDEAIALLQRAIDLDPQQPWPFFDLAQVHLAQNDTDAAIRSLQRAIELDPQATVLHAELGRVEMLRGNAEVALAAYSRALAIDPRLADALAGRGMALRELKRHEEAIEAFHRALYVEPDAPDVFEAMIDTLVEAGRPEEALKVLDDDIARTDRASSYWQKGRLLLDRRRFGDALQALLAAQTRDPENPGILLSLGIALQNVGEYDRARDTFHRVFELSENWPYALGVKAAFLSDIAEFEHAEELAARGVALAMPEGVALDKDQQALAGWLCSLHAWSLEHLGDPTSIARARGLYERAAALDPQNKEEHWKGLGDTLCRLGQEAEAAAAFQKIVDERKYKAGNDVSHLWLLGWCHYRLRRYDEAARFVQAALSNDTTGQYRAALEFDLGMIYLATSRAALAVEEYKRGIEAAQTQHPLRQRGIFYIALYDVVDAAAEGRIPEREGSEVFRTLRDRLSESGVNTRALRWLGDALPPRRASATSSPAVG